MKGIIHIFSLLLLLVGYASSQTYPVVSIKQVQLVQQDSLVQADATVTSGHTTLDDSPYINDTVSVWGVVMSKLRVSQGGPLFIPNLSNAYVFYIADTSATGAWNGIHVRASDTVAAVNSLVTILDTGMIVKITGRVQEFNPSATTFLPANNFSSTTQFEMDLDPGSGTNFIPVEINPVRRPRRPMPAVIQITDMFKIQTPQFATGEQWEGCYVEIRNVTVIQSTISNNRMTLVVEDAGGNRLKVVDDGYWYSIPHSAYVPPTQGAKLAYVRGYIVNRFAIAPLYPNDILVSSFPPNVTTVRRTPVLVKSTDSVTVTAKVVDTNTGGTIAKVELLYGIGGGPLQTTTMTLAKADSAVGKIPAQANGTFVRYLVVATDNDNEKGRSPQDTTREFNFYNVNDGTTTIRDVQWTPYKSGNTGYFNAVVSVRGVVTADTANLGANFIYIQDGVQPWSGLVIDGASGVSDQVKALKLGDDVTITGTVGESSNRTRLSNIATVAKNGVAPVPTPIASKTNDFRTNPGGIADGDPIAEQWESMLLKFSNLRVTLQNSDDPGTNFGEFNVTDGVGNMRVDDIGTWKKTYSNGLPAHTGSTLLTVGTRIANLTGVLYFGNSNYKLEPRGASDFEGVVTSIERIATNARAFALHQNYPNPLSASLGSMTNILYDLPQTRRVSLRVYDMYGREVETIVDTEQTSGSYHVTYDASKLTSGVYLYRLISGNRSFSRKMIVVK